MIKRIRYQLDLNKSQKASFAKCFGHCRFVYNYMLNKKVEVYKKDKTNLTWVDLCKELTLMKKLPEFSWLKEVANQSLQQSIRHIDSAFRGFFKDKKGYPKFKSKAAKQSCGFINNVKVDFENKKIKVPKIGWVRVFIDREFKGEIGTLTFTKNAAGKYFVTIVIRNDESLPTKPKVEESSTVGIDVGLKQFATLSTGEKIENPKFLEKAEQRLKALHRRLSRKQRGSNRRDRARHKVAKQYYKISCKRIDFLHKLTSRIIRENQTIVIEDLGIVKLLQNPILAKAISSASWYKFFTQLRYKADWSGKNLITIDRFEPSSKTCSVCGDVNNSLKLSERDWTCLNCGTSRDRDLNAAINIKQFGLKKHSGEAIPGEDVELPTLVGAKKRQGRKAKAKMSLLNDHANL